MFLLSFLSSPLGYLPVERYWISCRDLILCKTNLSSLADWVSFSDSIITTGGKPKATEATQTIIFCNDILLGRTCITAEEDQLDKFRLVQFIGLRDKTKLIELGGNLRLGLI